MNRNVKPISADPTRLLDQLRMHMRQQGLAYRTEQTYVHWIVRFIRFHELRHPFSLMAKLMYGSGLRISECLRLRVKDVDFGMFTLTIREGKGRKDRTTVLPATLVQPLQLQIRQTLALHAQDIENGLGYTYLPNALAVRSPADMM